MGTQLVVRLLPYYNARDPVNHFLASVNDLFRHAIQNLSVSDMVGITIENRVNQNDKPKRISILYDDVVRHYHVIVNINGAMAKMYVCNACNKACSSEATHRCDRHVVIV